MSNQSTYDEDFPEVCCIIKQLIVVIRVNICYSCVNFDNFVVPTAELPQAGQLCRAVLGVARGHLAALRSRPLNHSNTRTSLQQRKLAVPGHFPLSVKLALFLLDKSCKVLNKKSLNIFTLQNQLGLWKIYWS